MLARTTFALLLTSILVACGGTTTPDDAGTDAGSDAGAPDVGTDAGPPDPPPPASCAPPSFGPVPFRTDGVGDGWGQTAGDFTLHQRDGSTWVFSDEHTGSDSYVFFVHFPGITDDLIRGGIDLTYLEGPCNVHYFFLSDDPDLGAREALMDELQAGVETSLGYIEDEGERAYWRSRYHFATDRAREAPGSIGSMLGAYIAWSATPDARVDLGDRGIANAPAPVVFGIDRAQEWDPGDNLSPSVGRAPTLGMAAFLGHYYEYLGELDARLAAETATVVSLVDERTTLRTFIREVELPSATEIAAFDTMELDVEIVCEEGNPFACSEWDRIADVQLCADGAACTERLEIARWITPYWRRGRQRYLIDASPFLALLRAGGTTSFFVELGPEWERATEWVARVSLRFRTTGGPSATGGVLAYRGGAFDASYEANHPPFAFTPPAGATRVELVTILSGHGQTTGDNCAEWCDHRHAFSVDGEALPVIAHGGSAIGSPRGCAARAREGVIPGQWGNWAQSRAYWCPGLPVEARRDDITALVTPGSESTLGYTGLFGTGAPRGGDIALSAYVIWYTD